MSSQHETAAPEPLLTPVEARVIGCLMEKQRTTPDQYPLTLNGLVSACNQKSARHPVMNLSPGEVGHAVGQLQGKGLVHASFSGRTERYDHKLVGTFFLSREEQAILCVLMLRGPQTQGELRTNCARMADLPGLEAVTKTLQALMDREHRLVMELPRSPGKREQRFAHLLCGAPDLSDLEAQAQAEGAVSSKQASPRIEALEAEVASLRAELDRLWELTGLADRRQH
ncbi:DUF480 domain-containing protein [Thiorhodococcus mannitoliphagus]|uniref:DUF480 domain-containing protein n=1 Tax=Thiorhodococcus mannitoliphagus TaxID=329406 RepID=A0A6P1DTV6_9GAMM|nr:YceH family protein [Thiorhodococcus mannitoliphagus]NEX20613.1 DUF480 domain-containing protein [Thiorhodococcus mannitoliphagus]